MGTGVSTGLKIHIQGIVQGVGFRPFIYRLALEHGLTGTVLNNSQGVIITAYGEALEAFVEAIPKEIPPASRITSLVTEEITGVAPKEFTILASQDNGAKDVLISPDLKICADCLRELEDENNHRHNYPFINCTNCGPRYTIIKDVPYDRPLTTMGVFPMCENCAKEYKEPSDRRFHAQPNACGVCGPQYKLLNNEGSEMAGNPVDTAKELLKAGKIVAVKGIGGFHLACDGKNEKAVMELRQRKHREAKPLALMVRDLAKAKELAEINLTGENLLSSAGAPIVLLPKKADYNLPSAVAPGNDKIGIMLAYAPIHFLLLDQEDVLVMTSANLSAQPMVYDNEIALAQLKNVADYFLVHNREIVNPVDDSVMNILGDKVQVIRRGRGYAPVPLDLPASDGDGILALGGELKATFGLAKHGQCFLSPHLGDLENQGTYNLYKNTLALYKRIFQQEPKYLVGDLHPQYFSTNYGKSLNLPMMQVQHHHAHIASVLAEHKIEEQVIGVALDGTGYGDDGSLWGGEFLVADLVGFKRVGHFPSCKLPGGAKAIKEPWRLAALAAYEIWGDKYVELCPHLNHPQGDLLIQGAKACLNTPLSTSAGRVFDCASALLGICLKISYEGQAAIELENLAKGSQDGEIIPLQIEKRDTMYSFDLQPLYRALPALKEAKGLAYAARSVHLTMAAVIAEMVKVISQDTSLRKIAFSGGVIQNTTLMILLREVLRDYEIYINEIVPPNDGGLAYGQLAIAQARLRRDGYVFSHSGENY